MKKMLIVMLLFCASGVRVGEAQASGEILLAPTDGCNSVSTEPDPCNRQGRDFGNFRNSEASIVRIASSRYMLMYSRFYGGFTNAAGLPCLDDHEQSVLAG